MRMRPFVLPVVVCLVFAGRTTAETPVKPLRVAVYADTGVGPSIDKLTQTLAPDTGVTLQRVKAKQIQDGALANFDVLICPGGSGGGQAKSLGEKGRAAVRAFVERGGGYVGVCAGAYLATCDYSWSLGILNAKVVDKKHWARGVGDVDITLSPQARKHLGDAPERIHIHYHQGPLLAPGEDAKLPAYQPWATFEGDIAKKGAPQGVMPGTTAIAAAVFGKGRVICFSPHPELTPGQGDLLFRGVLWAAGR